MESYAIFLEHARILNALQDIFHSFWYTLMSVNTSSAVVSQRDSRMKWKEGFGTKRMELTGDRGYFKSWRPIKIVYRGTDFMQHMYVI